MAWTDPPSKEQLSHLRRLAQRKGQSFAYPTTRQEASREIDRLRRAASSTAAERALDHQEIASDDHPVLSSARVREDEIQGYGSSARWRGATS
jgi:hypothetical protein